MDTNEKPTWPASTVSPCTAGWQTLNDDPYNVRAEQLAMEQCKHGISVKKELFETDLVTTWSGSMIPGTPDGGFWDADDLLWLVQVVRVPLRPEMSCDEVVDVLFETVLTKMVKSQAWMKQTCTLPHVFIIFCWLPPVGAYEVCLEALQNSDALLWLEALLLNVQSGGWPFRLQVEVPGDPGGIFPAGFGKPAAHLSHRSKKKVGADARVKTNPLGDLCYFTNPDSFVVDEEDNLMEWSLFDQEDEHHAEEQPLADITARLQRLVHLAIHIIEQAVQRNNRQLAGLDLAGPQEDGPNYYSALASPQSCKVYHPCRGRIDPETWGREAGDGVRIGGLPCWGGLKAAWAPSLAVHADLGLPDSSTPEAKHIPKGVAGCSSSRDCLDGMVWQGVVLSRARKSRMTSEQGGADLWLSEAMPSLRVLAGMGRDSSTPVCVRWSRTPTPSARRGASLCGLGRLARAAPRRAALRA